MISTEGMLTVAETAQRLRLSTEQVRRNLRDGKLKGQRIGNQWFVEESSVKSTGRRKEPLIPLEVQERARKNREAIFQENGIVFDIVEDLRRLRESN